ncbi:MAG TPA: hypothetical protein VG944_23480 [Fimbriimonas sp.]|nr:hypothetical protein [Fimbriimonas sp.]
MQIKLISSNGWSKPVTVKLGSMDPGWSAKLDKTSFPSLPKGVTVDTVTITAAANTPFGGSQCKVSATSGKVSRYLNGGNVYDPGSGGAISTQLKGLVMQSPFTVTNFFWQQDNSGKASVTLLGEGITTPLQVKLQNEHPELGATLEKSTVTPSSTGSVFETLQVDVTASQALKHGRYPLIVKVTDPTDGFSAQQELDVDIEQALCTDTSGLGFIFSSSNIGTSLSHHIPLIIDGYAGQKIDFPTTGAPAGMSMHVEPSSVTLPSSGELSVNLTLTLAISGSVASGNHDGASLGMIFNDGTAPVFQVAISTP